MVLPIAVFFLAGAPLEFAYPKLRGFNFEGGIVILPELMALILGLVIYTGAFIAEIVRAGIQGVPKGQKEAARAIGLTPGQTLRLVVIPQAMRIIIPPLTSNYLNLTKNSSLAVAIAYPDLVSVFAGTVLNQTGQAVEVILITMLVYLSLSLLTSLFMNWFNARMALVESEVTAMQRDLTTDTPDMPAASASDPMRPPRSEIGVIGWLRHNLFSSWGNALLTVVALYILWRLVDGIISWGIVNAVWTGEDGTACRVEGTGACWVFIKAKFGQFIYGRYPDEERWRVDLVFAMAVAGLVPLMVPQIPGKAWSAGFTFFIFPVIAFWLLTGSASGPGAGLLDAVGLVLALVGIVAFGLSRSGSTRWRRRRCGSWAGSVSSSRSRW